MLVSGLDGFSGASTGQGRPAPPAPATTADLEKQGVERGGRHPQMTPRGRAAPPPAPSPHQLVQPFLLMSRKEVFLTSWVLGKFKETTVLKGGPAHGSFIKDVAGSADISLKSF